jgi:CMP-N,N'-diacetyllegionaminic acid synthase
MTRPKSDAAGQAPLSASATCVGLIPARAGSKRVPNKNVRDLAGHPLLAYSICAALDSGVFAKVVVSTESEEIAELALRYGAEVPLRRPEELAGDKSPDIEWVRHMLDGLAERGQRYDCFAILRPTSPFRRPATVRRAWRAFLEDGLADSLRAVEKCVQHPGKMWTLDGSRMRPLMANPDADGTPWHSTPYQALPPVYVQNASLEIARCDVPLHKGTIAGDVIMPFLTEGLEGFDINGPEDWILAEHHARQNVSALPDVRTRA